MNSNSMAMPAGRRFAVPVLSALVAAWCLPAQAVDWDRIDTKSITAFYPGVASFEFTRSSDHGTGAAAVKSMKKACADCHVGEGGEFDIGSDRIAAGTLKKSASKQPLEPSPVAGMPGFKTVQIKAAYDADSLYLWLRWPSAGRSVAGAGAANSDMPDRITLQIGNAVPSFAKYGCFIACHDDQAEMPNGGGKNARMYAYYTRASGALKPQADLDGYRSKGQFMDLWEIYFEGGKAKVRDQSVLHDRLEDNNDLSVDGRFAAGSYTVVVTRKLSTGDTQDIALQGGSVFNVAIAIHEAGSKGRLHHVTFPVSVGPAGQVDVVASRL